MAPTEARDGRTARRDRNRTAVLDAVIALFSEGVLLPTPEEVAARSGVSQRSVYRYFEDRDALVRAAIGRQLETVWELFRIHAIGTGPLAERIERFVRARVRLYENVAPGARAARRLADDNEVFRKQVEASRAALREQLERHFAPELDALSPATRRRRLAALDTLCQPESLELLRQHRRFSPAETEAVLAETITALLGAPEGPVVRRATRAGAAAP